MKRASSILVFVILTFWAARNAQAEVGVGSTWKDVQAELGSPRGRMEGQGRVVLFYEGGAVEFRRGKVSRIDPDFGRRPPRKAPPVPAAAKRPGHLLDLATQWVTRLYAALTITKKRVQPVQTDAVARPAPPSMEPPVKVVSDGGREVDVERLLVAGRVTIVDFYADWCGPCRRLSPMLEEMATRDSDLFLRKIDIVRWGTDVARQHGIERIPNMRVYNRSGQMVGMPTSDVNEVVKYVAMAK
jgi:thioredoxin 1